ncbi:MAG: histidine kinase [Ornithinibacter sp.]
MSAKVAEPAHRRSVWGSVARRVDPFVDPVIGAVAAALALASLMAADLGAIDPRLHEPNAVSSLATAVAAGSLAWRRTRPVASYAAFLIGALVVSGTFHYIGLLGVLMPLSLFSLATYGSRRAGVVGLGAGVACFLGLGLAGVPDLRTKDVALGVALLVAAWALAEALRSRREQQRDRVQKAVTQERLRIARELHDVVAHSMSLIAVQAGVGAHVIRTNPAAAEQSLGIIADTSRKALEQTRTMLGMLREESEDGTRPPTHGLDDLAALVEDVRCAGLAVELVRIGPGEGVDAAVSLAAYRIVQESLTNVIKHSSAAAATVKVVINDKELDIEIRDPGPRRAAASINGAGHGLLGLRERARLVGGALDHGADGDGFGVHATLPAGAGR